MFFEMWLKNKGYKINKLSKKEGRALYKQFGQEMIPVVKDCTNFLNAILQPPNNQINSDKKKAWQTLT